MLSEKNLGLMRVSVSRSECTFLFELLAHWHENWIVWMRMCVVWCGMCRNAEKIRNENCFFYDFDVNLSYYIIVYIYLLHTCKKQTNKKTVKSKKKSRITTVQCMTLYTQLTVYDAKNMDIQYSTHHNPININKSNGRHVDFIYGGYPAFF